MNITVNCLKLINWKMQKEEPEDILMAIATKYWFRYIQKTELTEEYEFLSKRKSKTDALPSSITDLNSFLDKDGLLRCRGRLGKSSMTYGTKNPILLPRSSYFTELVIRHHHNEVYHMVVASTLSEIRKTYWITKGRSAVKALVDKCVTCKWINSHSFKTSSPPDLPKERVMLTQPFSTVGVDYTGGVNISCGNETIIPCSH